MMVISWLQSSHGYGRGHGHGHGHGHLLVGSWSSLGLSISCLWSSHSHSGIIISVMVISQTPSSHAQGQLTVVVVSWSPHDHLKVMSVWRSSHGHFMVTSRSSQYIMATIASWSSCSHVCTTVMVSQWLWSCYCNDHLIVLITTWPWCVVVISLLPHGHLIVTSWSSHGHLMATMPTCSSYSCGRVTVTAVSCSTHGQNCVMTLIISWLWFYYGQSHGHLMAMVISLSPSSCCRGHPVATIISHPWSYCGHFMVLS